MIDNRHKDYKCESCGKSFSHRQTLKTHIYTIHHDITEDEHPPYSPPLVMPPAMSTKKCEWAMVMDYGE